MLSSVLYRNHHSCLLPKYLTSVDTLPFARVLTLHPAHLYGVFKCTTEKSSPMYDEGTSTCVSVCKCMGGRRQRGEEGGREGIWTVKTAHLT